MPLTMYTLAAGIVSYLTWPYLWVFGHQGFLDSLLVFSDFQHMNWVLFEGQLFLPTDLPGYFIPKLMLIQFSEPLVSLALAGLVIGTVQIIKRQENWIKLALLLAWFLLPILYVIIRQPVQYNNFRQYIFIMPPLFIFAALVLEWINVSIKRSTASVLMAALLCIPALISLVRSHPYQYIYYNQFGGGIDGAYQEYQFNYLYTAFKDGMAYVNKNIRPGSAILVGSPTWRTESYTEHDYLFVSIFTSKLIYLLLCDYIV